MNREIDRPRLAPQEHFPLLERVTYLNSAGIGLVPLPAYRKLREFVDRLALEGTRGFFDAFAQVSEGARSSAARLLNCDPSSIAVIQSVSEIMGQVAWSLRPGAGQNVVTIDIDHPAMTYPWLRVAEETGLEVRFVKGAGDPANLSLDSIAQLVDRRTAVISVSHCLWMTGHLFDLKQLARLAEAHGAWLMIDATHTAGVIPIDAATCGADLITAVGFKWLCGLAGASICYLSPRLCEKARPILTGHKSQSPKLAMWDGEFDATEFEFVTSASKFEYGSTSQVSRYALADCIDYINGIGVERIQGHVRSLGTSLIEGLLDLGAEIVTPQAATSRAGIVCAKFPGQDPAALCRALDQQNVAALPRMGSIRFSPHFFNDAHDIERALSVLAEVLTANGPTHRDAQ